MCDAPSGRLEGLDVLVYNGLRSECVHKIEARYVRKLPEAR